MHTKLKLLISLLVLSVSLVAYASGTTVVTGGLNGATFQNHMDNDGDGLNGRGGLLRSRGNWKFAYAEPQIDTTIDFLDPQGDCGANELELTPSGVVVFSSLDGESALFAAVDSTQTTCAGSGSETVHLFVVGGVGDYVGATGDGEVVLPADVVLVADPAFGSPQMVYSHAGTYELRID